jgi:LPXTG-motif cell wall-anchored protein
MVALTGTAHAQYVPGEPGMTVDPGTVVVGGTIEVQGSGCPRGTEVKIYVGDVLVATTTTAADNGQGLFDVKGIVLAPGLDPGAYTVHAKCATLDLTSVLSISAVAPTTTVVTGTLPKTGASSSGMMVQVGIGMVAVGGLVVLATRRRRQTV